ncbi:MAG: GIN domain-containing protein, partial [Candidatus Binatia bacterium]
MPPATYDPCFFAPKTEYRRSGSGPCAGSFRIQHLEADELQVSGYGATEFLLSGRVNRHVIDLAGSGDYHAGNLVSKSIEASVSGVAKVSLSVVELLDI